MKCQLVGVAVAACLMISASAKSDPMTDIFHGMYSYSIPSSGIQGNGRYGVNLGSFSYRVPNSEPVHPISAQMPRFQVDGCGNIDIFAGSFSLMSGDQLQQVGRAIMQGAGAYAFQLALAAISPLSAAEMEKLQRMLQDMNKWSIDGCKKGQQWAQDLVGKAPSDVMNVWGEQSSLRQAVDGLSEDAFSSFFGNDKKSATKGMKELGIETDVNTLQDLIQNATYTNIFMNAFGGLKSGELLMTIYGTDIVKASNSSSDCPSSTAADGYCSVPLTGKLSDFFINLFINKKDLNSDDPYTFEYYSCANAKCTDVATKTYTGLERLRPKIKETLSSAWDHIRAGQPLTAPETSIAFLAGNDIPIMIQKYGPSIKDTYLDWKSTMMARKAMVQAVKNINDQLNEMISSDAPREFPLPGTVKLRENMATLQEGVAAESQLILEDEQRVLTRINTLMALRDAAR